MSAFRYYDADEANRQLQDSAGSKRDFTACFFTLAGKEDCTSVQSILTENDCEVKNAVPGVLDPTKANPVDKDPLTPEEEAAILNADIKDEDDGLAAAIKELKKLKENNNKIAALDDVNELVVNMGELDSVVKDEEETPAVKKAR